MKNYLIKVTLSILVLLISSINVYSQCESWGNYPLGIEEAKKQHVIYRDKFKQKKYDEAFPIWEELFKYVKVPTPAKTTHYLDGVEMYVHFAKSENDKSKRIEYIEKIIDLYNQNANCNGEDALMRTYQGYYMCVLNYDLEKSYRVFELSMRLGGNTPPSLNMVYMSSIGVRLYKNKTEGFDSKYLTELYDSLNVIYEFNKDKKDSVNYKKYWVEVERQFNSVSEIFGCDYFNKKYKDISTDNLDSLKTISKKLLDKCGSENELYKKIWGKYISLSVNNEIVRQNNIINSDTTSVYGKIQSYRVLAELDSVNCEFYLDKINLIIPKLIDSKIEWVDDITIGNEVYRYAYGLYKNGDFVESRKYCRISSKFRPNWGQPYILIGSMYLRSNLICNQSKDNFENQIYVLVAIDEWNKAKMVDETCNDEVNDLINKYVKFIPSKSDLLVRQLEIGSDYYIDCWIQQSTKIRGN